ncbi:MAG TPA: pseudouridine synthase [Prolixibacteraceae bacterium]|nr:pseudouridine synthase [Prolixibacteraceae bacterium]
MGGFRRPSESEGGREGSVRGRFSSGPKSSGRTRWSERAAGPGTRPVPEQGRQEQSGQVRSRRRTLGELRAQAYLRSQGEKPASGSSSRGGGKKLVLKGEKRPSRGQLLRELGHSTERQPSRHSVEKEELIRLNRFIANSGICSRREADTYITAGVVKVNGQIVTELGTKISPTDEVRFDDRLITPERKVYLLLNKPKDVVTTTDDPHAEHTVMDLVKGACEERIYPVGRLDRNTTGLLLLTNDGDLSKRLTHPSHKVEKVYQVTLDRSVSVNDIQTIASGIELDDGFIAADALTYVEGQDKDTVGIEIHSGRHRIVRRIFEHLGYRVKALDRVSFAGLTKKNIPRGKWRFLTPREVSYLKMK